MVHYDIEIIVTQFNKKNIGETSHSVVRGLSLSELVSLLCLNEYPKEHYKITMNIRGVNY